jgi:chorismate dehydratase
MSGLACLRVGRLPYLNALPFAGAFAGEEPRWHTDVPRRLGELAAAGRLDAALLASRDALALEHEFRSLDLGIACRGRVGSVLLFSREPVSELDGARVALTAESRTSRALLRILMREHFGVRPRYVAAGTKAEACLAIGDAALAMRAAARWPFVLDLGAAWASFTGLPFVYARWVVRRDLPTDVVCTFTRELEARLDAPIDWSAARRPTGLGAAAARAYLAAFTYRLGPAECAGLRRFHRELSRHDLLRHHRDRAALGSAA